MGAYTDFKIKSWQEAAGIEPATGAKADLLEQISRKAFELIKAMATDDGRMAEAAYQLIRVIELERSGIRDGDGYWYGGDVIGHTRGDMLEHCTGYVTHVDYATSEEVTAMKDMAELLTKWRDDEQRDYEQRCSPRPFIDGEPIPF